MSQKVKEEIRQYIAENILFCKECYSYPDEASFLENGIIDSMNVLELVVFIEEQFGITVDDQEITPEHFDSVSCLSAYVEQKSLTPALAD